MAKKKQGPTGSLMERMLKNEGQYSSVLADSDFFEKKMIATTPIPVINIALSGSINGGFNSGPTLVCGESRTFKTGICLLNLKTFLDTYEDGIANFYDNEFGAASLFKAFGIDTKRVIHKPFKDIEELKHIISLDLEELDGRNDKIFMMIDSIGQAASRKEREDAVSDNVVADMTRAKALNSFWRIVTPQLTLKNVPLFGINHSYKTLERFSKDVMSGGTKGLLAADTVWFTTRAQIKKEGGPLEGWTFKLKAYKSRYIKEGSIIPYEILYDGGFSTYGGLFEIALVLGFVQAPKQGWYIRPMVEGDKSWRKAECTTEEWWQPILEDAEFHDAVENLYKLDNGLLIKQEVVEQLDKAIENAAAE
ncbi:MAG: recombinase RecA [Candidatus Peribacteraceae bacterium]|nr:recombinase RecA [Candidatus Peribacteraceae bacterium]